MSQEEQKRRAAEAALAFVEEGMTLGVGTGSTVNHLIDLLAERDIRINAAVSSSNASTERLQAIGIPVLDLNEAGALPLYIDGADEFNRHGQLIKGGGGALTREKIIAAASERFVCIVDESKLARMLGSFPLAVEVIPMARSHAGREIQRMGGKPELRTGFTTDNGNIIIDIHGLEIQEPIRIERRLNDIPGVVCNGLFAMRGADTVIVSGQDGIERIDVRRAGEGGR